MNMIQEKLKELELQLNYICYDKELITRLSKVWDAYYDLKSEVKKLNIPAVIGELTCYSCGSHPNVIYTTSNGRFCERCKPAS